MPHPQAFSQPGEDPDAAGQHDIGGDGHAEGQYQHHRHDDQGLPHETQAGQPQFGAVPPTQESGHQTTLFPQTVRHCL